MRGPTWPEGSMRIYIYCIYKYTLSTFQRLCFLTFSWVEDHYCRLLPPPVCWTWSPLTNLQIVLLTRVPGVQFPICHWCCFPLIALDTWRKRDNSIRLASSVWGTGRTIVIYVSFFFFFKYIWIWIETQFHTIFKTIRDDVQVVKSTSNTHHSTQWISNIQRQEQEETHYNLRGTLHFVHDRTGLRQFDTVIWKEVMRKHTHLNDVD